MDRCEHDRLPKVGEACADDAAVLALSVTRFVAAGYMTGDVACWDAAYDGAERVLGEVEGQAFVAAMTGVMRAIRAERAREWSFMPAVCCRVTSHEQELLALLDAARASTTGDLPLRAARFANAPAAPRLAQALRTAATTLEKTQRRLASQTTAQSRRAERPITSPSTVH